MEEWLPLRVGIIIFGRTLCVCRGEGDDEKSFGPQFGREKGRFVWLAASRQEASIGWRPFCAHWTVCIVHCKQKARSSGARPMPRWAGRAHAALAHAAALVWLQTRLSLCARPVVPRVSCQSDKCPGLPKKVHAPTPSSSPSSSPSSLPSSSPSRPPALTLASDWKSRWQAGNKLMIDLRIASPIDWAAPLGYLVLVWAHLSS